MNGGQVYRKQNDRELEQQQENERRRNKKKDKKGGVKTSEPVPEQPELVPPDQASLIRRTRQYFPKHSFETVRSVVRRYGNNMNLILDAMLNEKEDEQLTRSSSSESKTTHDSGLQEDFLMNLDAEVEINKNEFEELFEEISEIIQNRKDINSLERNCLIDECKDSLNQFVQVTVGFVEELNISDVSFQDLLDRENLVVQLQLFIENVAKELNEVHKNKKLKGSSGTSIVTQLNTEIIKNQLEKDKLFQKKEEYFTKQNKLPEKWNELNSHFLLNDNNSEGGKEIKQLATEYEGMDIVDLKIIYSSLLDLDTCRRFLKSFYHHSRSKKRDILSSPAKKVQPVKHRCTVQEQEELNSDIMKLSLAQIREFICHHAKIRAVFMGASSRISAVSERKRLQFLGNQYNDMLGQYMRASQVKFIEKALKQNPNEIDFHGYFMTEAVEIAEKYINQLAKEARNVHPKVATKMRNGRPLVELHIITGKGLNSARKKSVLKPAIQEMCDRLDLSYENTEGGVLVRIPL